MPSHLRAVMTVRSTGRNRWLALSLVGVQHDENGACMTICDCCGRNETACSIRHPLLGWVKSYGLPKNICSDCLAQWYSGGLTDPTEIKRRVLAKMSA